MFIVNTAIRSVFCKQVHPSAMWSRPLPVKHRSHVPVTLANANHPPPLCLRVSDVPPTPAQKGALQLKAPRSSSSASLCSSQCPPGAQGLLHVCFIPRVPGLVLLLTIPPTPAPNAKVSFVFAGFTRSDVTKATPSRVSTRA